MERCVCGDGTVVLFAGVFGIRLSGRRCSYWENYRIALRAWRIVADIEFASGLPVLALARSVGYGDSSSA